MYNILKYIFVVLLLCIAWPVLARQPRRTAQKQPQRPRYMASVHDHTAPRKKVGVVLSGGGAKGVAHVTALRVIEEAGIPIDYIAGTSMGAIIGGLYSIGYDTYTLDSLVRSQNWPDLLADRVSRRNMSIDEREMREKFLLTVPLTHDRRMAMPSGLLGGNNVLNLLTELAIDYHDSLSFKELPIPFTCVAYDLASGKSVNLNSGFLPQAIRASMSIPGAFEPVRIGDMVLIDGGITNNFPCNVVREMGAEVIIGVDVAAGTKDSEDIRNLSDMFNQITWYTGLENYDKNLELCDVYIHPDITGYNAGSFSAEAVDSLLVRGERGARGRWGELIAVKDLIGIPRDYMPASRDIVDIGRELRIDRVVFEISENLNEKTLRRVAGIKDSTTLTSQDIQNAVGRLQGMGTIEKVNYRLDGTSPYTLVFNAKEASRNSLSLGVRFDSEEMAALMLGANIAFSGMSNSHFEVRGRLSENPYAKLAYVLGNETERKFTASYMFKYNNLNMYYRGDKASNMDFGTHTIDLNYSNIQLRDFRVDVGIKYEYFDYDNVLVMPEVALNTRSEGLISYYLNAQFESFDRHYSPTKGISVRGSYALYTTNFVTNHGHTPFSVVSIDFLSAISLSSRVALLPGLYGRVLIGDNFAFPTLNIMGGTVGGRYLPQQIPFVGIHHFEKFDNAVVGATFDFRVRLWKKNYVSLKTQYARQDNNFFDLLDGRDLWGVGLAYCYPTFIGPLDVQVDYSSRTKSVGVYFSIGHFF